MSIEQKPNDTTVVKEVELDTDDINSFLSVPGAENVMIAEPADTVFTNKKEDKFLDNPVDDTANEIKPKFDENGKEVPLTPSASAKALDAIISEDLADDDEDDEKTKGPGRQKTDKSGLVEMAKKLIEAGVIIPFEDDKPIEKYTQADFEELITANFSEKENKVKQTIPLEFFDSLPKELQYAAKYHADGGTDMKGLFQTLAQVEESRQLDPSSERDQETIIRNYLQATRFGSAEDIQEEIDGWKDHDQLEAKAMKFKPKLDAMQEQVVEQKLLAQQERTRQQSEQAREYMNNIYKVLEPAEINGIQIDKRTQSMLYAGLIQPNYPSISGKNTNLLGHLLEKYQFVEPNHGLIAEALWLLADPDGYKNKVRDIAVKENVSKTVRTLKTEESRKLTTSSDDEPESAKRQSGNKIKRQEPNFFKR